MTGLTVIARRNAAQLLELCKATLYGIARPVHLDIQGPGLLATAWWNHRLYASSLNLRHKGTAVIALVCQDMRRLEALDQRRRLSNIVDLSRREDQPHGPAMTIAGHVNLRAQSTSGTPQRRVLAPPFPVAAC